MNSDFGTLISRTIIDLNILKDKLIYGTSGDKPSILTQGLLCNSKRQIVDVYLQSISNVAIMLTSLCQVLILIENSDHIVKRVGNHKKLLRDGFSKGIMDAIQSNEHCTGCPKGAMLFGIMQNQLEDVFFADVITKLIPFIGSANGEKYKICVEILDDLYEFAEAALLHLSGLRIDCSNLKDSIYDDDRYPVTRGDIRKLNVDCPDEEDIKPDSCIFKNPNRSECLHIFLHDGIFHVKSWLDVYVKLYEQYHKYPKKINLILDYKIVSSYTWVQHDFDRYIKCKDLFGEVFIINADHIDFGPFKDTLHITTYEKIEECVYE